MSFELRRADATDVPLLARHRLALMGEMGARDAAALKDHIQMYRRWVRARLRSGSVVAWVATTDGNPAGTGIVFILRHRPHPSNPSGLTPYLMGMYTEPPYRRQGIANAIVRASLDWAKAAGYPAMVLHASDDGRAIYEQLGFQAGGEMWRSLEDWG